MQHVNQLDQQMAFAASATAPQARGVTTANAAAQKFERRVALAVVIMPFLGLMAAIIWHWGAGIGSMEVGLLVGMYTATIMGIGMGFHRLFSHGAFQTTVAIRVILAILGSMAAQGPVLWWAAIHRRHHAYSDCPGDPHSPHLHGEGVLGLLRGLWHAHTGWLFIHEVTDWAHYIPDLLRDTVLFRINRLYFVWVGLGLVIPAAIGGLLSWTWLGAFQGFLWGGVVRLCLGHHATWSINSITHVCGSRPFRSRDQSVNNFWIALLVFGEGWHNNHHMFPNSAKHGLTWWQIDISGWAIRALELAGLAWNVKAPTARMIMEAKRVR
jgi:stearoyl-CoA desaturase (delta-9 desaturase)